MSERNIIAKEIKVMSDLNIEGGAPIVDGGADDKGNNGRTVSYETHQRLLDQKKKADERARLLEEEKQSFELEKQKAEGKKDEVIQSLEGKLEEEKGKSLKFVRSMTDKTLNAEITKAALSKGIRADRVDKFLKLSGDSFRSADIQLDENFSIVNRDIFDEVLEKEAKDNEDWFHKIVEQPDDVTPSSNGGFVNIPDKKLSEKSVDELAQML